VTTLVYTTIESSIGELLLLGDGRTLHGLHMQDGRKAVRVEPGWRRFDEPFGDVVEQLRAYLAGRRFGFDVPVRLQGTPFQLRVWNALREVPYGETLSYGELAGWIGRPEAARAVGHANGSNAISVIVPCHRLVGADGTLVGYGGGLERKQFLLSLEAARSLSRTPGTSGSRSDDVRS